MKVLRVGLANQPPDQSARRNGGDGIFSRFVRDERGSLVIFTLFLLVVILIIGGMAVDVIRHETKRAHIQATIDRGVLAAADLDQTLDATDVVESYMETSGLDPDAHALSVTVTQNLNSRSVSATANYPVPTAFMDLLGIEELLASGASTATEGIMDVEISLVLDVSGSMNSNSRLTLLKTAATAFVDTVIPAGLTEREVSISVVPFATQVSAGAGLLDHYNATTEHSYSHCVDFASSDFNATSLSTTQSLQRTGHFDPWTTSRPPSNHNRVCRPESHREILAWAEDPTTIKNAINALVAGGNTSIDIGTKWGTALLDPSSRSIVTAKVAANEVHADFAGRPFDYGETNTMKVMVVMSDGQNTSQYYLRNGYRSGPSDMWYDPNGSGTSDDDWSAYDDYYNDYYHQDSQSYHSAPDGGANATEQSYAQLWNHMSIRWWAQHLKTPASGNSSSHWRNQAYSSVGGSTKNTRTSNICQAAKDQGILVFTIGMDTYGQGDATLLDCASSPAHFFDVTGVEISTAFAAIATQINQLKLVQ